MCLKKNKYTQSGQFKDGHDYKDKYIDTSSKILSQEMTILHCGSSDIIFL